MSATGGGGAYGGSRFNGYYGSVSMPIMQSGGGRNTRFNNGYSGESSPRGEPQLSTTNLYIRGLSATTTDDDLRNMCATYGKITSTKAIMDKLTNQCKGYGFVDFETAEGATAAVEGLQQRGVQAQMAKARQNITEQDPTNLYLANLPINFTESQLENALQKFGMVISTRILRNGNGESRGVGFARMDGKEKCEQAIHELNGKLLPESPPDAPPLLVKLADSGHRKKRPFNVSYMSPGMIEYQGVQEMYGRNPYPYVMPYGQSAYPHYQQYDMSALTSQMGGMHLQNGGGNGESNGGTGGAGGMHGGGVPYTHMQQQTYQGHYGGQQQHFYDTNSYAAAAANAHYGNSENHEPMGTFIAPNQNGNGAARGGAAVKYGK